MDDLTATPNLEAGRAEPPFDPARGVDFSSRRIELVKARLWLAAITAAAAAAIVAVVSVSVLHTS